MTLPKKRIGSTLESLFDDLGEREEFDVLLQKKLLASKIGKVMAQRHMSQTDLAKAMRTSRNVVHRLLDPNDTGVTLATLCKASKALGVQLLKVA